MAYHQTMSRDRPDSAPVLVLDTASPVVSLAVGIGDKVFAERRLELRRSSEKLLDAVDAMLAEADIVLDDLSGAAAVRGPGSFTGLRVGLGTVLGWHQALELRATGLDGHEVLALAATRLGVEPGQEVTAAVDALRGDWCVRTFRIESSELPEPAGVRRLVSTPELIRALQTTGRPVIGFGVEELASHDDATDLQILAAPPLAPAALELARQTEWDPGLLVQPIYFREPAVSVSKRDPAPPPVPDEEPRTAQAG
ncbi:MAG: tRNA (adenosine(37)-N6)-threonylcarbamoyltransferase complex dimerization subunit type 1 TsaB [Thermoanaerobaculia bacterium]|nr:tRNA (adenosine(37)-N6)-threonylcarbamoyltransferase complex dimerization subunit type 1 TsaB [Thermoanaerobaculia bacterium]